MTESLNYSQIGRQSVILSFIVTEIILFCFFVLYRYLGSDLVIFWTVALSGTLFGYALGYMLFPNPLPPVIQTPPRFPLVLLCVISLILATSIMEQLFPQFSLIEEVSIFTISSFFTYLIFFYAIKECIKKSQRDSSNNEI